MGARTLLSLLACCAMVVARLDDTTIAFISDFFVHKRARIISTFTCSTHDSFRLTKRLQSQDGVLVTAGAAETGVVTLPGPMARSYQQYGALLDLDCSFGQRVLNQSSALNLFNGSYTWLFWSGQPPSGPDLAHLKFQVDSQVTWASGDPVQLHDLYKVGTDWPVNVTHAGSWDWTRGVRYTLNGFKYYHRQDLRGITFQAAIVVANMPTDHLIERLTSPINRHLDTTSKLNYAINRHMQDLFNFTVNLHPTPSWGYLDATGAYDGMIGMLQRGEVELGATSATIKLGRLVAAEFVGHTWKFQTYIIFRHPHVEGIRPALFTPFSGSVWLCSGVVWALVMSSLRFVAWLELRRYGGDPPVMSSASSPPEDSWSAVLLFAVGTISQHGTVTESQLVTWRLVILVAFVLAVFLNAYYSAAIVTSLLVPPPKNIRTLRNLIDSSLEVGMENISFNTDYFARTIDPLGLELYRKKVFPPGHKHCNCYTLQAGVTKLRKEAFAFQAEVTNIYPTIEDTFSEADKCALTLIPLIPHAVTAVPTARGWPYRKMLSYGLHAAFERGLINRQFLYWKPQPPRCTEQDEAVSVGLGATCPALMILGAGLLTSALMLLWERRKNVRQPGATTQDTCWRRLRGRPMDAHEDRAPACIVVERKIRTT